MSMASRLTGTIYNPDEVPDSVTKLRGSLFDSNKVRATNEEGGAGDFDEYYEQAEDILDPKFQEQMDKLASQQVNRGFYGQMPGDVMQQELKGQQTSQIAQYAQDLKNKDWQKEMQKKQFELQKKQFKQQKNMQNQRWEEKQDQSTLSSMGTGAAIGSTFGPVGAAVGGGLGWLADTLF